MLRLHMLWLRLRILWAWRRAAVKLIHNPTPTGYRAWGMMFFGRWVVSLVDLRIAPEAKAAPPSWHRSSFYEEGR